MKGGVYRARNRWRVCFPWRGQPIWVNRYLDGTPLYSEAQALRVLERIRSEVDQGVFDPSVWGKDKTLQVPEAWRIYSEQSPCGRARGQDRDRIFTQFIEPYFKDKSIREIRSIDIADWFSKMPKTYKPSYLRVIRATFRAFFWFHSDSLVKMPKFPIVKVPHPAPLWLSESEQEKVFEFIPTQHRGIIRFIVTYGCRPSEACNLKRTDIDWEKRLITLTDRKAGEDNTLPILPQIEGSLRGGVETGWLRRGSDGLQVQRDDTPGVGKGNTLISHRESCPPLNLHYVFSTSMGLKYRRQTLLSIWMRAIRQAHYKYGVKIVCLKYGTRHSLASRLLNRGESIEVIARILGNSVRVVEKSYARFKTENLKEAMEK